MKYQIGDLVADEDGNSGIVVIKWDDGDLCSLENDAAHPNPTIVGHWPDAPHQADPADLCNCSNHTHGDITAGWICPVHGQQF